MWVYKVEHRIGGASLVLSQTALVAVKVLKGKGIELYKDVDGEYIIDTIRPEDITGDESIYLSNAAELTTTFYKGIAKATGLRYVKYVSR